MSVSTIIAAVKAVLEATAGISGGAGTVSDHEPRSERWEDLKTHFTNSTDTLINGWTVSRDGLDDVQEDGSGRRFLRTHAIRVKGYYGLKEASPTSSEETFQALVDAVHAAIIASTTIWVDQPEREPKTISTSITHTTLQNAVVHFAELRFGVDEITVIA